MRQDELRWQSAGPGGTEFAKAASASPGWYWILRPHQDGPGRWDPSRPVMCPIHVFPDGRISSPLADLRELRPEQLAPRGSNGTAFPSYFAGPIRPGRPSGQMSVEAGVTRGDAPSVPGWYWCRTNPEAPLIHVDVDGVGPILLDRGPSGDVRVWSTSYADGTPVDVGELGFSEPLASAGGIIDASGELGRTAVEFFGRIDAPAELPRPAWSAAADGVLCAAALVLPVADVPAARAALVGLGFREGAEGKLAGAGLSVRLVEAGGEVTGPALELDAAGRDLGQLGAVLGLPIRPV